MATITKEVYPAFRSYDESSDTINYLSPYDLIGNVVSIKLAYTSNENKQNTQTIELGRNPFQYGSNVKFYLYVSRDQVTNLGDLVVEIYNYIWQHENAPYDEVILRKKITIPAGQNNGWDSIENLFIGRNKLRINVYFTATTTVAVNVRLLIFQV